jgi:hypothetical protein
MIRLCDIFDQPSAMASLRRRLRDGTLPHGMIFSGVRGVGKGTSARALAAAFLCESLTDDIDSCGKCKSCLAVAGEQHPDCHIVYRELIRTIKDSVARDLSVEVIREFLVNPAGRKTVLGRGKVFIVEEAETMSAGAQNALLKTLEEPAGRTLIILLTDQASLLLPTVRSRAQVIRFSPLPVSRVRSELMLRGIAPADAEAAAALTDGSLGLALRWLRDGVVAMAAELIRRIDALPEGAADLAHWIRESTDAYAKSQQERDPDSSKDQASRDGAQILFRLAAEHFRRQLALQPGVAAEEALCERIESTIASEQFVDANVSVILAVEELVASWCGAVVQAQR